MPATRPTTTIDWTDGNALKQVEPSSGKKLLGWTKSERPPFQYMNFLFYNLDAWVKWLDYITQLSIANLDYQAYVGSGLTGSVAFADFNALMASPSIASIKKVLVLNPMTVVTPQIINADGIEFVMHPSAVISKGGATNPGIHIQANGVTFSGAGRFTDFSGGSDAAIRIAATFKNNRITGQRFLNCTTGIDDLGTNNDTGGNIEEV